MFSYASSFVNYLLSRDEEDEEGDEDMLEAKLAQLQIEDTIINNSSTNETETLMPLTADDKTSFKRTGIISYMDNDEKYVLIDGVHFFDTSSCSHQLRLNDKVLYLGYYKQENQVVVVKILQNEGNFWGEENTNEEELLQQTDHTLIGQVASREGRVVYMTNGDIKFNLDNVDGTFVPIEGDLLEMRCKVVSSEGNIDVQTPRGVTSAEVLEVIAFRPLGLKIVPGTVSHWNGTYGLCNRNIYIDQQCLPACIVPKVGDKVMMKTIESCQNDCVSRAIQLQLQNIQNVAVKAEVDEEESTLQLEKDERLDITNDLSIDVEMDQRPKMSLEVTNRSDHMHIIKKWIILSKKRDSQIYVTPNLPQPYKLHPGQTFTFIITCQPKFLGKAKENMLIMFKGFKIKRVVNINVVDKQIIVDNNAADSKRSSIQEKYSRMKEVRNNTTEIVYGRPITRQANFVAVRVGNFPIPEKLWNLILGDSEQLNATIDKDVIFKNLEDSYGFLKQDLNIYNYVDKWHCLVHLEEIYETINLREYDIRRAYLVPLNEYLSLEVKGLSERRPSLVLGDKVVVRDILGKMASKFEGIIHEIRGNCVLMKFSRVFHESYSGSDVSVEFQYSRGTYRKAHHAVNWTLTRLGPEILFPSRLSSRTPQVPSECLKSIKWCNDSLNDCQRAAVSNILLGECRPMPYCIYGPPGTGKTVTLIETILQILENIPHSRILVATPSNSAANLIAERLLDYKENNPYSMARVVAYYYSKSDKIPEKIRSYCVTIDIAREGTAPSMHEVQDSVNINCQSSYLGRHRVTIGTCSALGSLIYINFPKGHFTHVIVDEAGQATEPEIMIPLTLTDKDNGQIILAGDPMQLGPIVGSLYAQEFGLDVSYLSRILETVPYLKDYSAFKSGFNEKLVTKLNDNYRSMKEVLTLPSQMFYDGTLVEKFERNHPWVKKLINVTSDIFERDVKAGGIYVHGIRGCNTKAENNPSWYNPQEATMVALTASKMYKRNVSPDDIGIITPYIAQVKHLHRLFEGMGLPLPKIGTVEDFQGQERHLIIISTVRTSENLLQEDEKFSLGFVQNPKRLNVALTRAQVAVMLFCDPHLLSNDQLWSKVLKQAVQEDKYMGCDLPKSMLIQQG